MAENDDYINQFKPLNQTDSPMSFLTHIDVLRKHILRAALVIAVFAIVVFANINTIFDTVILSPQSKEFITYKAICSIQNYISWLSGNLCSQTVSFSIINTDLTGQFMKHITVSLWLGLVVAMPYILFEVWLFVSPALLQKEKRYARGLVFYASILFFLGIGFGYFVLSPLSIVFLGNYQVSEKIANMISLDSYISTLTTLTFASGLIFEMPMIAYFLAKVGLIDAIFLREYRRYAIVVNMILAAIITPSDVLSMLLMTIPLLLLYEVSIKVIANVEKNTISE